MSTKRLVNKAAGTVDAGNKDKPVRVSSLQQAQSIADQFVIVPFMLNGHNLEMEVRRLRPDEDAQLAALLEGVVPPIKQGKTPEDDRIDFQNMDFLKRKSSAEITARSLALYWCVPLFANEKPNLSRQDEINAFVQSKLTNAVLNLLYAETRSGGIRIPEYVNSFSAGRSLES